MKNRKLLALMTFCLLAYTNCTSSLSTMTMSSSSTASGSTSSVVPVTVPTGTGVTTVSANNQIAVTVGCGYENEPCVSVTICIPGTTTCQTISNVLLDTGSYGLRLFSSQVSLTLPALRNGSGSTYAECVSYADGSSDWGSIAVADIQLGGQVASSIPMQLIDSGYAGIPSDCDSPDTDPASDGFNGILGIGQFTPDCGSGCATEANNRIYFTCSGSSCASSAMPVAYQVSNPVPSFPLHNNGLVLTLPAVPDTGAPTATGTLTFGIGTASNNVPGNVSVFLADENSEFGTTFNGVHYDNAFIDSGSVSLAFPPPAALTLCNATGNDAGFFCPASVQTYSATQQGVSSSASKVVSFAIANTDTLSTTGNSVFGNLGAEMDGTFDWGLPFFLGRSVYVNFDGKSSTLATGAAWAY